MPSGNGIGISATSTVAALGERDTVAASTSDIGGAQMAVTAGRGLRYEDLGLLGEGGMGVVRRVRDRDLLRELALKRLRAELREDRRQLRQFLWEARVTAHLDHPNIVPLHDIALADDGTPFFTMKLVRGQSLRERIEHLRSTSADARGGTARRVRLFLQLCCAIEFAHVKGVLHRDLKPENIVVGEHGELLVMDWGIAAPLAGAPDSHLATLAADAGLVTEGRISGTPLYMSPEQAAGSALDARSDVYTLGVILYELLALRHPFEGSALPELLVRIVEGKPTPLLEVSPDVSRSVVAVVEKAMHVDPQARYPTVAALREDVETLADGGIPGAEQVSIARRLGHFYVRDRNPWMTSLRAIDFEILLTGGVALGLGVSALGGAPFAAMAWPLLLFSFVITLVGIARWRRNFLSRAGEDPPRE